MPLEIMRLEDESCFSQAVAVGCPVGQPVAYTRTAMHRPAYGLDAATGIWECSPGKFRRQIKEAEYSYVISGEGRFISDDGKTMHFGAGDSLYFSAYTEGTWEIQQTLRKAYLIFG